MRLPVHVLAFALAPALTGGGTRSGEMVVIEVTGAGAVTVTVRGSIPVPMP
ncbi:MAG: hypothetical protein ACE5GT_08375 [Rhodospirillales bacterium]